MRDVPAPEPASLLGETTDALDKPTIEAVLERSEDEVETCYLEALEHRATLDGEIVISFVVQPDGTVNSPAVALYRSTIAEPAVGCCLARITQRWQLPKPKDGKPVALQHPFVLTRDAFKLPFPVKVEGKPQPASGTEIHTVW